MSTPESELIVANQASDSAIVQVNERDIVFNCPHCEGELVVDRDGAGMTFNCPHCGGRIAVPFYRGPDATESQMGSSRSDPGPSSSSSMGGLPGAARLSGKQLEGKVADFSKLTKEEVTQRVEELKLQLKEHQSQTTEMRGHLNRAVIEMNRLQLKLQKLRERGTGIEQELAAAKAAIDGGAPAGAGGGEAPAGGGMPPANAQE